MRRASLRRRLFPPVVVAASVLVGLGCGVLNPDLLGLLGVNTASGTVTGGNVVVLVLNNTSVTAQANVTVTKQNGGRMALNMPVEAGKHVVVVQNCEVQTIQVDQASYAGDNGAVVVPGTISPVTMGSNLECGGGVVISITGTPPGVFLNAYSFP